MRFLNKKKYQQTDAPRRRLQNPEDKANASSRSFTRNRTIIGPSSVNYDSVNSKSDSFGSPRAHIHHLTIKRRKVFSTLVTILLAVMLLWLLISNFIARPTIELSDKAISTAIDSKGYEKTIQDYLGINPMSRFSFFLNQADLSSFVAGKMPEVLSVKPSGMSGIGQTGFILTMRRPVAGWNINNKQYYVDSNGVAFEKNYFTTPEVQIVDNSGVTVQSSTAIVSNRLLSFVGLVVSTAKTSGFTVSKVVLPIDTTRQLDVSFTGYNYYIKLSIDRPVGEQIEDASRAVKYLTAKGRAPGYIDVRVSGKAFYK